MNANVKWIEESGTVGAPQVGVGAIVYCWEKADGSNKGFNACHDKAFKAAQQSAYDYGLTPASPNWGSFVENQKQFYMGTSGFNCNQFCKPAGTATPVYKFSAGALSLTSHTAAEIAALEKCANTGVCTGGFTQGQAQVAINSANQTAVNYSEASAEAPCTDSQIIQHAQSKLGVAMDGVWGPLSQAAFDASGKSYADLIFPLQCQGPPPKYVPGSPPPAPKEEPPPPVTTTTTAKKKTPWALILGLGFGGAGLAWFVADQEKKKRGLR